MFGLAGWEPDNNGPGYQPQQAVPPTYRAPANTEEPIDWGAAFWAISRLVLVAGGFAVLIIVFRRSWRVGLALLVVLALVFLVWSAWGAIATPANSASPPSYGYGGYREQPTSGVSAWTIIGVSAWFVIMGFLALIGHRIFVTTKQKEYLIQPAPSGQFPIMVQPVPGQGQDVRFVDPNLLPWPVVTVGKDGKVHLQVNGEAISMDEIVGLVIDARQGANRTAATRAAASGEHLRSAPVAEMPLVDLSEPMPPVRIADHVTGEDVARQLGSAPSQQSRLEEQPVAPGVSGLLR
jgi:hypothetical protein